MSFRQLILSTVLAGAVGACEAERHPTDAAMMAEFQANRVLYDSLLALADADRHLWRIADSFYRLQGGENRHEPSAALTAERWNLYQRVFRQLQLAGGVSTDSNYVAFERSGLGLGISGSGKGLIHFLRVPGDLPLCRDLDSAFEELGRPPDGRCYRHLDGAWYLFVDWT